MWFKRCPLGTQLCLPTVDTILRNVTDRSWFGDLDLGEMFLNYPLHRDIQPYAGVDVTEVVNEHAATTKRTLERWNRMLMGFKPSPYIATMSFAWSEELIIGNYTCPDNPFYWDSVKLNLPGQVNYQPELPWVYCWDSTQNRLPGYFGTYIDDIRSVGANEIHCSIKAGG